jgi:cytochrome c-type biogenesis protein CcmH/NrfF
VIRLQNISGETGLLSPRWKSGIYFLILLLAFFTLAAGDQSARFDKVGHNLMCTCGCNQILLECNHVGCPNSDKMRSQLASHIDSGASDDSIYKDFVSEYGNIVVAAPIGGGFNRMAWIMPFAVLFVGMAAAAHFAKKWSGDSDEKHAESASGNAELDRFRAQARKETEL